MYGRELHLQLALFINESIYGPGLPLQLALFILAAPSSRSMPALSACHGSARLLYEGIFQFSLLRCSSHGGEHSQWRHGVLHLLVIQMGEEQYQAVVESI